MRHENVASVMYITFCAAAHHHTTQSCSEPGSVQNGMPVPVYCYTCMQHHNIKWQRYIWPTSLPIVFVCVPERKMRTTCSRSNFVCTTFWRLRHRCAYTQCTRTYYYYYILHAFIRILIQHPQTEILCIILYAERERRSADAGLVDRARLHSFHEFTIVPAPGICDAFTCAMCF